MIYYINDVTIDNKEVLVEYGAAGTATGTYEYGLQRLSVEHVNEAKEYYLYNGTGNVTQTTAENGSMFLRYTYDPFGNVTSINAPMTVDIDDLNRYTYNGEDYDYNTGLQYLRARYYSTGTGDFISQDTYLGKVINPLSQNRYTYVGNSPTVYSDPSGHLWHILAGGIVGGLVGFASSAIVSCVTTGKLDLGKAFVEAGTGFASGALMATGLPVGVVAIGNGLIDTAGSLIEQKIEINRGEREDISLIEAGVDGAFSAVLTGFTFRKSLPNDMASEFKRFGKRVFGSNNSIPEKWSHFTDALRSKEAKKHGRSLLITQIQIQRALR